MNGKTIMTKETSSEDAVLNYWKMKNMSTSEYESGMSFSAWSEWDKVTGADDDDNNGN